MIWICMWIRVTFPFFHHCRIEDFWIFVSFSHTIYGRFVPFLPKWLTPTKQCIHNILEQIQQTSGLIRKSGSVLFQILALAQVCALWVLLLQLWYLLSYILVAAIHKLMSLSPSSDKTYTTGIIYKMLVALTWLRAIVHSDVKAWNGKFFRIMHDWNTIYYDECCAMHIWIFHRYKLYFHIS